MINSLVPGRCGSNLNTLRSGQNGCYFPDNIFKWIFLSENVWSLIKVLLKFDPKGPSNNIPAMVQIMAWRLVGAKPLSESMIVSLLLRICVTQPQWVKSTIFKIIFQNSTLGTQYEIGLKWMQQDLGPVSLTFFCPQFKFDETSSCCNSVAGHQIATNFCTCHDSTAVVPCTKVCSDLCIRIEVRVKRNFHRIWITMEKPLVKRAPV